MNTKELESCLHIIGYWLNEDETVIEKILNNETQIVKRFVEPFSKELNANLLNKDTIEAKKDLIKFYVFEFWELQGFYKEYDEILFTGSLCNYTPVFYEHTNENGTVRKLNEFENYVVNSWSLFNMLFNEIQICCIKYKIDFFKVCYELNFSLEYFDSGISIAFEEMQKENLPPQQTTTENDTIKYTAKHYVLGYLIECNAKGESFPIGQKKELEKIGNEKMGTGKGNRFYKVFNEIVNKDLNIESNLIEIGGENWRTIVKDLSNEPETIETYLQSKQL